MTTTRIDGLTLKFVEDDAPGSFAGYAATWDRDRVDDVILPGAFKSALGRPMPALLWGHDPAEPIGVIESLAEDGKGLAIRGRLADTARGREARTLAQMGALALSVGITGIVAERKGGVRFIKSASLVEVSLVGLPANPAATITTMKADPAASKESVMDDETPTAALDEGAVKSLVEAAVKPVVDELATTKRRLAEVETKANRPRVDATPKAEDVETKAFTVFIRRGREALGADEIKTLRVSDDTAGGYLAPGQFLTELDRNLVLFSPVRAAARIAATTAGSVTLPKRSGTLTASWVGEEETRPESQPAYGQAEFPVHEQSVYVDVTNKMLEDSAFNVEAELAFDLAEEFGRHEGHAFVRGDGVKKPVGLLNSAIATVKSGHASGFVAPTASASPADCLKDMVFSLPGAYAANAVWGMNRTTMGVVAKFKDAQGRFIWQDPLSAGQPATIMGRPVVEMPDLPDVAANANPIVFGDFNHFRIFDRLALSVLRDPYSQAASGKVRFHARRRLAAGVTRPEAFRLLKIEA